jgi:hypothetical protein
MVFIHARQSRHQTHYYAQLILTELIELLSSPIYQEESILRLPSYLVYCPKQVDVIFSHRDNL